MKKYISSIILLFLLGINLQSQIKTIKGIISSSSQESVNVVSLILKASNDTIQISENGNFSLNASSEDILLIVINDKVYDEISIGDKTLMNINVDVPAKECKYSENGMLKMPKEQVPFNSYKILPGINGYSNFRVEQLIDGRTSGTFISPESGSPGSNYSLNLNGIATSFQSAPLFIVDGMFTNDIRFLNPQDIETIEILNDPAALALYGMRGGNGVILIKTKLSKSNIGKIEYNFITGIQNTNASVELLNADEYSSYLREGLLNEGRSQPYIDSVMNGNMGANTNWLDELFEPAIVQKHNISFSGGSETSKYYASGSYLKQNGIIGNEKSSFEQLSIRLNSDYSLSDKLKVGSRFSYVHTKRNFISDNTIENGIIKNAMNFDPTVPINTTSIPDVYSGNPALAETTGEISGISSFIDSSAVINPLAQLNDDHSSLLQDKIIGGLYEEFEIIDNLSLNTSVNVDVNYDNFLRWTPTYFYNNLANDTVSAVYRNMNKIFAVNFKSFLKYKLNLMQNDLYLVGGYAKNMQRFSSHGAKGEDMAEENDNYAIMDRTLSNSVIGGASEGFEKYQLNSYFIHANYSIDNKYLLNLSFRSDEISALNSEFKNGIFPAVSLGWILSNEDFWSFSAFNFLKLNLGWGQTGNLSNFNYIRQYDLVWESSTNLNLGIETRMLDNHLDAGINLYLKNTSDLMIFDQTTDTTSAWINSGELVNKGINVDLGYYNSFGDVKYNIGVNLSFLNNEVTKLGNTSGRMAGAMLDTTSITMMEQGNPIWSFYGYKTNGFSSTGEVIYKDIVADGILDEKDLTYIGDAIPNVLLNTSINLNYQNFDFGLLLKGSFGNEIYDATISPDKGTNKTLNLDENIIAVYEDPNGNLRPSDLFVHNGSYLKVKEIQFGYRFDKNLINKLKLTDLRIFLSAKNLMTFTSYQGLDPEMGSSIGFYNYGVDRGFYPNARIFMLGLTVSL